MQRIAEGLRRSSKFRAVDVHLGSGSIIVHHDAHSLPVLTSVLEDLGIVLASATDLELPASTLAGAVRDLDRRLGLSRSPIFDLRNIVPAAFAGLALRQLFRYGMQIEAAPWYVLAYVAFESFDRLHRHAERDAGGAVVGT
jgi:hypothetical protein